MTYSDIKQKPATRAGQCFEVSASALMVTIEAEPPDDRIIKASQVTRKSLSQFRGLRQGARSRTRWVIGVRHRKVTKKLFSWPFRARVSFCLATKVQKCVAVDPGTWGRIRMMTLGDNIMKADELERLVGKSGQGSMHAL